MKTIKIEITISEGTENNIVSDIKQQIEFHLEQKKIAHKQKVQLQNLITQTRETIKKELNQFLGSEAWFDDKHDFRSLGFRDGIYRNTCYNSFDIIVKYDVETVKYGTIEYTVPNLVKGLYIQLKKNNLSMNGNTNNIETLGLVIYLN